MAVNCPHCERRVNPTKNPRPGQYQLTCPACQDSFELIVPKEANQPWQIRVVRVKSAATDHVEIGHMTQLGLAPAPHSPDNQETGRLISDTPAPEYRSRAVPLSLPKPPPALSVPESEAAEELDPLGTPRIPQNLPGYRLDRIIGTGGMGSVYLGRQLSLDRPVAVKVMSKKWCNDPIFVARFTREAFAAALLNHPNVVQIYDIGDADGIKFFSMEYVAGRSLSDLVKAEGKIDPEIAVGYLLQAARGLKHAHDRGMIHRDVKPDNLLLDEQGIVKVADLGLVKTPDMERGADKLDRGSKSGLHSVPANMTGVRMALGTPAYMAPEQCRDAASVDHRADIYSLGCTLYVLVTGKQPFDGKTAVELMTKHAYEPLVPPEMLVSRLPKELSAIIQKMMEKEPRDRYQSMTEVIRVLEQWLGIHHTGTFCPRDEQIDLLEQQVYAFNNVPTGHLRNHILMGFIAVCLLGTVLLSFFGLLNWAFGTAGVIVQTSFAYFVLNGLTQKTYLFRRVRQCLSGLSYWDWALLVAGVGLFHILLGMLGLFWMWAGFAFISVGLAVGLRYALDCTVEEEREQPLKQTERLLRRMRLTGVDEEEIRGFVAKYAGRHWEEFFEALFGYESKIHARQMLLRGGSAGVREKYAAWREPIIALIDYIEKARQEARDRTLLEQVEQARLLANGESLRAAQEQAAKAAAAMAKQAQVIRQQRSAPKPQAISAKTVPNIWKFSQQTQTNLLDFTPPEPPPSLARKIAEVFFGKPVRAVLASVLVAACVMWALQNRLGIGIDWKQQAQQTVQAVNHRDLTRLQNQAQTLEATSTRPLEIEGIPARFTNWVDSAAVGWAGLLLLLSLLYRGNRLGFFLILGSLVMVAGHRFGIRNVEPLRDYHVSLILGTVLTLIGFRMARKS